MTSYIKLLRPAQWVKNAFVFLPLFFGGRIADLSLLLEGFIAFFAFSFAASAIYCVNDIVDVEADRNHPVKCNRPVAAGRVSIAGAWMMSVLLAALGIGLALRFGSIESASVVALYIALNLAYCFKLKQIAILDVFVIALGFVLRVALGGIMCGIWLSPWIVCMTFLLALFLAFAKRRDDVVIREETGVVTRRNTVGYNLPFLNQILGLLASVSMVCYIIYCLTPEVEARFHSEYVYVTAVFVLAGILRYMQLSMVDLKSGSPTRILLRDRFLHVCILGWLLTFCGIIYLPRL